MEPILNENESLTGEQIKDELAKMKFNVSLCFINDLDIGQVGNSIVVVNTAKEGQPGKHWFCLFKDEYGKNYVFDSYGRTLKEIYQFAKVPMPSHYSCESCKHEKNIHISKVNEYQLQNVETNVCGKYILLFFHYITKAAIRHESTVEYARAKFRKLFTPIKPQLAPTESFINSRTLTNDRICYTKCQHIFPHLR